MNNNNNDRGNISIAEAIFCAFDLETCGLSSFSHIVEVGAVRFKVGEEGEYFQTLVNPDCLISPDAVRVHGITDEMVSDAPRARQVLENFFEFASGCVLVAHNAKYDIDIVTTELIRTGMELPPNEVICTIKASKRFLPKMPNYRLGTVVKVLGIDHSGYHRALADAVAARHIFERTVTAEPSWENRGLSRFLEQCSSRRLRTKPSA